MAWAQSREFSQAILSPPSEQLATGLRFDGARLFSGLVVATITNRTGAPGDFEGADVISASEATARTRPN
jgi:hypothetical protein